MRQPALTLALLMKVGSLASAWIPQAGPGSSAAAQDRDPLVGDPSWEVEDRLFGHDQMQHWGFSQALALDGDRALVGAWGADVAGDPDRGAAYVFVRQGKEWVEQTQLLASDGAAGDRFGRSVALYGDTAVIGAPLATIGSHTFQGAVYVFERSGGMWAETGKLLAADGVAQDRLGSSVAIAGSTIVAGADGADINGNSAQGAAYIFEKETGSWIQQDKLFDPDGQSADLFGNSASLDGDTILIGAESANVEGDPSRGAAYVFTRTGRAWMLEQRLLASDGENPDEFGFSVALDGDVALIGARQKTIDGNLRQGAAYVFRRTGAIWEEEQRLTASDGQTDSYFGWSVALDGNLALVGGRLDFPGETQQGVVYEFRRDGPAWVEVQRLEAPVGHGLDGFGEAISLTRTRALISNNSNVLVQPPGGTAWIFRRPVLFEDGFESGDPSAWTQTVQ